MLANFKKHAKEQITKKQKAIETLTTQKQEHEEKILRITERIHDKKIKGMISDESDESEEEGFDPKTIEDKTVTIEEFQFVKSKRKAIKLTLKKWVADFQTKHKRLPNDGDTAAVVTDIMDFNFVNQEYLAFKLKLIKQQDLPFDPNEFYKPVEQLENRDKIGGR